MGRKQMRGAQILQKSKCAASRNLITGVQSLPQQTQCCHQNFAYTVQQYDSKPQNYDRIHQNYEHIDEILAFVGCEQKIDNRRPVIA